jgi:hypothetical protein
MCESRQAVSERLEMEILASPTNVGCVVASTTLGMTDKEAGRILRRSVRFIT